MLQAQLTDLQKQKLGKKESLLICPSYYEGKTADLVDYCLEFIKEEVGFFFTLHDKTIPLVAGMLVQRQSADLKAIFWQYLLVPAELSFFLENVTRRLRREISRHFQRKINLVYQGGSREKIDSSLSLLEDKLRHYSGSLQTVSFLEKKLDYCFRNLLANFFPQQWTIDLLGKVNWGERFFNLAQVSKKEQELRYQERVSAKIKGILENLKYELVYNLQKEIAVIIYDLQDEAMEYLKMSN